MYDLRISKEQIGQETEETNKKGERRKRKIRDQERKDKIYGKAALVLSKVSSVKE